MKKQLISLVAVTSIALFSSLALAGGANCDSKKGHGQKDMSAEAWQEFKDSHAWVFSHGSEDAEKKSSAQEKPGDPKQHQTSTGLVEI